MADKKTVNERSFITKPPAPLSRTFSLFKRALNRLRYRPPFAQMAQIRCANHSNMSPPGTQDSLFPRRGIGTCGRGHPEFCNNPASGFHCLLSSYRGIEGAAVPTVLMPFPHAAKVGPTAMQSGPPCTSKIGRRVYQRSNILWRSSSRRPAGWTFWSCFQHDKQPLPAIHSAENDDQSELCMHVLLYRS